MVGGLGDIDAGRLHERKLVHLASLFFLFDCSLSIVIRCVWIFEGMMGWRVIIVVMGWFVGCGMWVLRVTATSFCLLNLSCVLVYGWD